MRQYNVGSPFEWIAIVIAKPFPTTDDGNKYIVVEWTFLASGWNNQEEIIIAETLVKAVLNFARISSDEKRTIESGVFQRMCKILGPLGNNNPDRTVG